MFKKLALFIIMAAVIVSPATTECGPIAAAIGYWATKAVIYTAAVVTVVVRPEAVVVVNPANTAAVAETSSTAVASVLAVLPLP